MCTTCAPLHSVRDNQSLRRHQYGRYHTFSVQRRSTFIKHDQGRLVETKNVGREEHHDKTCANRTHFYDIRFLVNGNICPHRFISSRFWHFNEIQNEQNGLRQIIAIAILLFIRYTLSISVKDHIRLIRSVIIIDNTFNLMLLGLLIYFGILFALYGFLFVSIITQGSNLSILRLIYTVVSFLLTFGHMSIYCVLGELLVIQCDGIYDAVCQYEWYNLKPKQARNFLNIMMETRRPLHLTAGKLLPMTIATLCNLLQTSGGYISVLLAHRS
ncbi:uncharacterized protein LOC105276660 isoform X3 [Ooceraea biroi]|uniref:uncharacterized protein LOC105276660 isoform X3 n=1 Tax=Ooceraea biroi TaxID=2015173 RepID=UPI0005B7F246|nr:uncharacterized protein LOC105276660 isoform X3 [Ooceraea biroi]